MLPLSLSLSPPTFFPTNFHLLPLVTIIVIIPHGPPKSPVCIFHSTANSSSALDAENAVSRISHGFSDRSTALRTSFSAWTSLSRHEFLTSSAMASRGRSAGTTMSPSSTGPRPSARSLRARLRSASARASRGLFSLLFVAAVVAVSRAAAPAKAARPVAPPARHGAADAGCPPADARRDAGGSARTQDLAALKAPSFSLDDGDDDEEEEAALPGRGSGTVDSTLLSDALERSGSALCGLAEVEPARSSSA